MDAIKAGYGAIADRLNAAAEKALAAAQAANSAAAGGGGGGGAGGRWKGGTVQANKPYFVGEDRRTGKLTPNSELFIPRSSGYIANAEQLWSMIDNANRVARLTPIMPAAESSKIINQKIVTVESESAKIVKSIASLSDRVESIQSNVSKLSTVVEPNHRTLRLRPERREKPYYQIN